MSRARYPAPKTVAAPVFHAIRAARYRPLFGFRSHCL